MKRLSQGPIFIAVVCILCALAIITAYRYKKSQALTYSTQKPALPAISISPDSISDKDWQELLKRVNENTSTSTVDNPTNSDIVSREIFARFVLAKQQGQNVTPEMANQIADDILKYADSIDEKVKLYSSSDLTIINNTNTEALQNYTNQLLKALGNNGLMNVGNELVIMTEALQNNNYDNIGKVKNISAAYENTAKMLLKIAVPSALTTNHLSLINSYMRISKDVRSFALIKTDPFVASKNFTEYISITQEFGSTVDAIKSYLQEQGITTSN